MAALSLLLLVCGGVIFAASYYMKPEWALGYHNLPVSLAKAISPLVAVAVAVLIGRMRNR